MHNVTRILPFSSSVQVSCRISLASRLTINSRQCLRTFSSTNRQWSPASQSGDERELDIGILGGGISGLSTAFYILAWHARAFPGRTPRITIYEGSDRVGGWVQTSKKKRDGLEWNFEHGPRTLRVRPESMLLQLIQSLGLEAETRFTLKTDPAAQNRYLYRGGSNPQDLARFPDRRISSLLEAWNALRIFFPLLKHGLLNRNQKFPSKDDVFAGQNSGEEDVSLGDLLSWITGPDMIDGVASAFVHGIYGADIYKLSAREVLVDKFNLLDEYVNGNITSLKELMRSQNFEIYQHGPRSRWDPRAIPFFKSLVEGDRIGIPSADFKVLAGQILDPADPDWLDFRPVSPDAKRPAGEYLNDMAKQSAVMTLSGGMETLTKRIAMLLSKAGVNIQLNTKVVDLESNSGKVTVQTANNSSHTHDTIVSTLDPTALSKANITSPSFASISPSLSMGLTTIIYRPKDDTPNRNVYDLANNGFGYLIPTAYGHSETNLGSALGVIFDSALPATREEPAFLHFDSETRDRPGNYAKLTVISGGRFWDEKPSSHPNLANDAHTTLENQLGMSSTCVNGKPVDNADEWASASFLAEEAIVQHGVGHYAQYNKEVRQLDEKFGAKKVLLSGRAAHGNGITQCVDGAVSTAVRVLMEGYGVRKLEEIVYRIRTPPSAPSEAKT